MTYICISTRFLYDKQGIDMACLPIELQYIFRGDWFICENGISCAISPKIVVGSISIWVHGLFLRKSSAFTAINNSRLSCSSQSINSIQPECKSFGRSPLNGLGGFSEFSVIVEKFRLSFMQSKDYRNFSNFISI